jgi:hypothetical protein
MTTDAQPSAGEDLIPPAEPGPKRFGVRALVIAVILAVVVTAAGIWAFTYLYPKQFRPVNLSAKEQQVLSEKLDRLGAVGGGRSAAGAEPPLAPERYQEDDAKRQIALSERELNSLLANNTNLASRLAIDLSDDLASARLLIPMEPDFPVLGGKIIRVNAGLELAYRDAGPVVVLKGVSVMGVPIPNAWLGNLKNVDLVKEFGGDRGFWRAFADGVEFIRVSDGELQIKLKE